MPKAWQPKKSNCQRLGNRNFFIAFFSICHCGLAIYMKEYLKANEELWKFQYFTMQKYNLQKKIL
jgi:hypothetical protein